MPDSLVLADSIEVLGGGVASTLPVLVNAAGVGVTFRLAGPGSSANIPAQGGGYGYDLGVPVPDTDLVQSLLLDGERPFGLRASNRTIVLPIVIQAPDQVTLTAAREILLALVDAQTWTLTWTPASTGLPLVFDCFRAEAATVTYSQVGDRQKIGAVTLKFQALPYGRSDPGSVQQVPFASPLIGGVAAPPAPVVLDNFGTVSGTRWSRSTSKFVVGPGSAHYSPGTWPQLAATYTRTGLSANITGLTALSVWFGQSYDTTHYGPWPGMASNVTLAWTLTDNLGHKLGFHTTYNKCPWSNSQANPSWTRLTAPIPQTSAVFNYTAVASYAVTISNWVSNGVLFLARIHAWLDNVTANPPSLSLPASQRGTVYTLMGVPATARTPVSCEFQLPQSGPVSTELQGSGLWWPPVGVSSVTAECVGAGGAGGSRTTVGLGGGGGGAEYARETLTVAPGTPVPYSCGVSGQPGATPVVVTFRNPGTASWTCPAGVTAIKAECWGGGGGGAPGGGGGGGGAYAAENSLVVTPGKTYRVVVGQPGTGGGAVWGVWASVTARTGTASTFAGDSVTVTANGGQTGLLGGTTGGAGGAVGTNTVKFAGGAGGAAPSYGGGGGGGSGGSAVIGNTGSAGAGNSGGAGAVAVAGGGAGGAGAPAAGWPNTGSQPGGGGGGGFSTAYNGGGGTAGGGTVQLTYTVAAGAPVSGSATTFGSAASTGTVVTANGGGSAALNTATGAAGGSGSINSIHRSGGAGFTATSGGGGGGGSGGSAVAGNAATSLTGAAAVTGGGKGANGGAAAGNNPGDGAAPPGGGGGGGCMTSTAVSGGLGGAGNITLTWTPPLTPFGTLVVHRPSADAPPSLNPCVPISNTSDAPSGTQYPVPSLVAGMNALFAGTYSLVLAAYNFDSPSTARQITVTIIQYEYPGGPSYPVSVTRAVTPANDIINGMILMGEVTLPVKDIDPSNSSAFFMVSIVDTNRSDLFLDLLLLDTQGETVIINIPPGNSYTSFYLDEPTPDRDLGRIMGSDLDRSQATSVLDSAIVSGGPLYIDSGDNTLLAYSPSGAPNLGVTFVSRWYLDRLS